MNRHHFKFAFALFSTTVAFTIANRVSAQDGDDYIRVEIAGTLETGIMAIGGETTGTTITAAGMTWEVQVPDGVDPATLDGFNGRTVYLRGRLEIRDGVEVGTRTIVHAVQIGLTPFSNDESDGDHEHHDPADDGHAHDEDENAHREHHHTHDGHP